MWRRVCPLLTVAFEAGLVITRRRLSYAQAERDHLRAVARTRAQRQRSHPHPNPRRPVMDPPRPAPFTRPKSIEVATGASELSSEWEHAVPPMDS